MERGKVVYEPLYKTLLTFLTDISDGTEHSMH